MSQSLLIPGNPGVTVERDVRFSMPDGVSLASDIYRPESTESNSPVLLLRQPYDKRQAENIGYLHPAWYARRGYIVAAQDTRGRYASEGEWYPFLHETDDGLAAIDWASHLPGSNGQVGMYGFSYGGATQLLPATQKPSALKTLCPAFTGSQYYDGWTYNGGELALAFAASWALSLGVHNAARRGDDAKAGELAAAFAKSMDWHWMLPLRQYIPLLGPDTAYFFDWLDHPTNDDYWQRWSIEERYAQIDVPALHFGGWYDVFLRGTIRNFKGLKTQAATDQNRALQRLVIGPWYHMPWMPQGIAPDSSAGVSAINDMQLSWFDRTLKGESPSADDSPVKLWLRGESQWRNFEDWPPPEHKPVSWFLHSNGRANSKFGDGELTTGRPDSEPADVFTYDPMAPIVSQGGHSCCFPFAAPMGPADQSLNEETNGVLVFTSPAFARDTLIVGDVSLILYAITDAIDTDWTARLCLVDESGLSTNLLEGIQRAQFRTSLEEPTPVEPNRVYEYQIDLGAIGVRVQQGERLRLDIASSDFPQWARNMNTGSLQFDEGLSAGCVATQVVLHDTEHPSHLILPVVPDRG